jgi:hypothetical protein
MVLFFYFLKKCFNKNSYSSYLNYLNLFFYHKLNDDNLRTQPNITLHNSKPFFNNYSYNQHFKTAAYSPLKLPHLKNKIFFYVINSFYNRYSFFGTSNVNTDIRHYKTKFRFDTNNNTFFGSNSNIDLFKYKLYKNTEFNYINIFFLSSFLIFIKKINKNDIKYKLQNWDFNNQ